MKVELEPVLPTNGGKIEPLAFCSSLSCGFLAIIIMSEGKSLAQSS